MRLQSPELHQPLAGTLPPLCGFGGGSGEHSSSAMTSSLCLPDSLAVYVGEDFTAYLGILNVSKSLPIRNLTVTAQLQTPSQRWQLPSPLDPTSQLSGNNNTSNAASRVVEPGKGVDAIVSHSIEEAGQHILRIETSYLSEDGGAKNFRKFYRFNVVEPLLVREYAVRYGDSTCYVSVSVEFNSDQVTVDGLVVADAQFRPADGLSAVRITAGADNDNSANPAAAAGADNDERSSSRRKPTAAELLDNSGILCKGGCYRYLFKVTATSSEALLRGIAAGDLLGRAAFIWRKAMGETGRVSSSPVYCPATQLPGPSSSSSDAAASAATNFVVYQSGLSVDVAAAAATRNSLRGGQAVDANGDLSRKLPVTIEPIDPPARMRLNVPREVQFLVVNHSGQVMTLQVQFRLSQMTGLAVCGSSFKTVGTVPPNGGSTIASVRFLPLAAGILRVQGCCIVDLASGTEILQPPLFQTYIEEDEQATQ